jgi:hypothetical protein
MIFKSLTKDIHKFSLFGEEAGKREVFDCGIKKLLGLALSRCCLDWVSPERIALTSNSSEVR